MEVGRRARWIRDRTEGRAVPIRVARRTRHSHLHVRALAVARRAQQTVTDESSDLVVATQDQAGLGAGHTGDVELQGVVRKATSTRPNEDRASPCRVHAASSSRANRSTWARRARAIAKAIGNAGRPATFELNAIDGHEGKNLRHRDDERSASHGRVMLRVAHALGVCPGP